MPALSSGTVYVLYMKYMHIYIHHHICNPTPIDTSIGVSITLAAAARTGSLCSYSRYFSRFIKVLMTIGASLQAFKSRSVTLSENEMYMQDYDSSAPMHKYHPIHIMYHVCSCMYHLSCRNKYHPLLSFINLCKACKVAIFVSTFLLGVDHVQDLAHGVLHWEAINVELTQSLLHLLVEVVHLIEGESSISIQIQAAKPVLNAVVKRKAIVKDFRM